jgi:hypothetical protein
MRSLRRQLKTIIDNDTLDLSSTTEDEEPTIATIETNKTE